MNVVSRLLFKKDTHIKPLIALNRPIKRLFGRLIEQNNSASEQ